MSNTETQTHKPQRIIGKDGITRTFTRVESIKTLPKHNFGFKGDNNTYHLSYGETFRTLTKELRYGYGLTGVTGITTDGKTYRYEYQNQPDIATTTKQKELLLEKLKEAWNQAFKLSEAADMGEILSGIELAITKLEQ